MSSRSGAIIVGAFGLLVLGFVTGLAVFVFGLGDDEQNPDIPNKRRYEQAAQVVDPNKRYTAIVETKDRKSVV